MTATDIRRKLDDFIDQEILRTGIEPTSLKIKYQDFYDLACEFEYLMNGHILTDEQLRARMIGKDNRYRGILLNIIE